MTTKDTIEEASSLSSMSDLELVQLLGQYKDLPEHIRNDDANFIKAIQDELKSRK